MANFIELIGHSGVGKSTKFAKMIHKLGANDLKYDYLTNYFVNNGYSLRDNLKIGTYYKYKYLKIFDEHYLNIANRMIQKNPDFENYFLNAIAKYNTIWQILLSSYRTNNQFYWENICVIREIFKRLEYVSEVSNTEKIILLDEGFYQQVPYIFDSRSLELIFEAKIYLPEKFIYLNYGLTHEQIYSNLVCRKKKTRLFNELKKEDYLNYMVNYDNYIIKLKEFAVKNSIPWIEIMDDFDLENTLRIYF
jgi:hypothetical protein